MDPSYTLLKIYDHVQYVHYYTRTRSFASGTIVHTTVHSEALEVCENRDLPPLSLVPTCIVVPYKLKQQL
eukprot:COSAG05_NODE_2280_length_3290_cov_13.660608_1_plen_70_part_00